MNEVLKQHAYAGGQQLQLVRGDITQEQVDAIVNAANSQLAHGGGLAAVIARRGGPAIDRESQAWLEQHGPVSHARPAYTSGGDLPVRYVIHAVGPVWSGGEKDEAAKLAQAVRGSLQRADELELGSIALPAISTGVFGYPKQPAAEVTLQAIGNYFAEQPESGLQLVRLTLFDQPTVNAFQAAWEALELGD